MVMHLFMLLMIPFGLFGIVTNNVDVEVQWDSIYANTPFEVTISVTHDSGDKIDPSSFTANNKKINPVFVKSVKMSVSSPLEISIYTLEMPGMPQGLQILPTIGVKIKDKVYSSIPSGFEVKGKAPNATPNAASPAQSTPPQVPQPAMSSMVAGPPSLTLEPIFTGTNPLYPGQRFFLGYRYLYNTSVDLSEEKLPLLEATGFKKIGDKQIDSGVEKGLSVTQVVQKVESDQPGTFTFPGSQIVGYAYKLDPKGQKLYDKAPLSSNLPSFEVKVLPFPEKGKPASFQGAMGNFEFQAKLMGPNQVQVGDKIQLQLTVTGHGELEQLRSPDLCCQPGFSGFFKPSDLPPVTRVQGDTKTFLIELLVENADTTAIPPIEFSFFNPVAKTYEKRTSQEIPLTVTAVDKPQISRGQEPAVSNETTQFAPFSSGSSYAIPLGLLVVLGLGLLVLQSFYSQAKKEEAVTAAAPIVSDALFQEAKAQESHPEAFYPIAIKAIRQKMFEDKQITSISDPLEKIPESPLKNLLVQIENERFSKKPTLDIKEIIQQMQGIFHS